jgi:hypothetical protein
VIDIFDMPKLGGGMHHSAEILAAYLESHRPTTPLTYGDRLGQRACLLRAGQVGASGGGLQQPGHCGSFVKEQPAAPDRDAGVQRAAQVGECGVRVALPR